MYFPSWIIVDFQTRHVRCVKAAHVLTIYQKLQSKQKLHQCLKTQRRHDYYFALWPFSIVVFPVRMLSLSSASFRVSICRGAENEMQTNECHIWKKWSVLNWLNDDLFCSAEAQNELNLSCPSILNNFLTQPNYKFLKSKTNDLSVVHISAVHLQKT